MRLASKEELIETVERLTDEVESLQTQLASFAKREVKMGADVERLKGQLKLAEDCMDSDAVDYYNRHKDERQEVEGE